MQGQASEQQQLVFFATVTALVEDIKSEGNSNAQYAATALQLALPSIA